VQLPECCGCHQGSRRRSHRRNWHEDTQDMSKSSSRRQGYAFSRRLNAYNCSANMFNEFGRRSLTATIHRHHFSRPADHDRGAGKKIPTMAAHEADIVSNLTLGSEAELAQRVSLVKMNLVRDSTTSSCPSASPRYLWTIPAIAECRSADQSATPAVRSLSIASSDRSICSSPSLALMKRSRTSSSAPSALQPAASSTI
jgi:hypothetical protein